MYVFTQAYSCSPGPCAINQTTSGYGYKSVGVSSTINNNDTHDNGELRFSYATSTTPWHPTATTSAQVTHYGYNNGSASSSTVTESDGSATASTSTSISNPNSVDYIFSATGTSTQAYIWI